MIKKIGITGPSGSGKSLIGEYLKKANIDSIDADALYHSMLLPPSRCLDAIASAFGEDILLPDGSLDRKVLSTRVFTDGSALQKLNDTVLPIVLDEIRSIISAYEAEGKTIVAIDAPTLIESGFHKECDLIVAVVAPREQRIKRAAARDNISEEKARERIAAQNPDEFYTSVADLVIVNGGDLASLEKACEDLLAALRDLAEV